MTIIISLIMIVTGYIVYSLFNDDVFYIMPNRLESFILISGAVLTCLGVVGILVFIVRGVCNGC